ncbi:AIG2 protein [Desulfitobacterium hafniense]|uniref:AIG2 protein n=1 Tax=Desulfitobacterium hafniense TaxID=49338 RepID=A0A098B3J7_DESHA|nr:gamma-glutamylcyclotransferase family protein [Desulfitobacterium hafniense]CDX03438.1 AIG2 protein [Desulfitobacterium hafniense]
MYYFAYGSNLHKGQMLNRCPDAIPVARVKLHGYQLTFNRVADIVKEEQAVTWGAIYTVSPEDIKNLDRYEGYPRLYNKMPVTVEDDRGNTYQAFAYVLTIKGCKEPSDGYYQIIKEGYWDWGLPLKPLREALKQSR